MKDIKEGYIEDNSKLPPRRHIPKLAVIGIVVLIVLIVFGSFTSIHLLGEPSQLPTPTLEPGSNLFYIETSPDWGSISIDGQVFSHLSARGIDQPLELSTGAHVVQWNAAPFPPQECTFLVPPNISTTQCLNGDTAPVPKHPGLTAYLLTFTASTMMLTDDHRMSLFQAAQTTLSTFQSTETVQSGELYVDLQAPHFIATATQPLRARLYIQLDTTANSNASCQSEYSTSLNTCNIQGQNCHLFCGIGEGSPSAHSTKQQIAWIVFAALRATWKYSTLSGQVVTRDQPDGPDNAGTEVRISLSITWVGSKWHVTVTPFSAVPACATAIANIPLNMNFQTTESNPNLAVSWKFVAGSNLAAGCLAEAFRTTDIQSMPSPKPIAFCLYRFGIFTAVDSAAHRYWPNLPRADIYEQSIARRLEALPVPQGQGFVT